MFLKKYRLRNDDAGADAGGGGAAVVDTPAQAAADKTAAAPDNKAAAAAPAATDDKGGKPADAGKTTDKPADGGGKPAEAGKSDEGFWPADWREKYSKEDVKKMERLKRYASPEAAFDAMFEAQNRIAKGELKPVLGKNPTPEQLKEWREAHGIPEDHTKYDLKDVKTDQIKPEHLDLILKNAHAANQTPDQVKATVGAAKEILTDIQTKMVEKDASDQVANEDALRSEWGGEFRKNIGLIHGLLDGQADQDLKDNFLRARLPDGTLVGNHPGFMRMALQLAMINNPTGTVVAGAGANVDQGIREELGKIEKTMAENRAAYNKDEKMQARFRELTGAAIARGLMDENGNWKK